MRSLCDIIDYEKKQKPIKVNLVNQEVGLVNDVKGEFIKLYKYFSPEQYNLESLQNLKVNITKPNKFNDPYDCSINYDRSILNKLANDKQDILEECFMHIENLEKSINKFINKTFITCYSEIPDSILMWSHYSKNHSGFCLEYDMMDLYDQIYIKEDLFCKKLFAPVIYDYEKHQLSAKGTTEKEFNSNIYKGLFYKTYDWVYEQEWRMIYICKEESKEDRMLIDTVKPKSVILGCRTTQEVQNQLEDICKKHNINLDKMELDTNKFSLNRTRLYSAK